MEERELSCGAKERKSSGYRVSDVGTTPQEGTATYHDHGRVLVWWIGKHDEMNGFICVQPRPTMMKEPWRFHIRRLNVH